MIRSRHIVLTMVTMAMCLCAGAEDEERSWEEKFNEVYRLEEGEILKRIAPPFIGERDDYYRARHASQARHIAKAPNYFTFHWRDEKLRNWGYGFRGSDMPLADALTSVLQMPRFEFEGPEELTSIKLAGDWIIRPEATIEQKLEALAGIVKEESGITIQFEQKKLPRNVIVASGTFTAETRDERGNMRDVHLYVDEPDRDEGSGGGSGTMEEFITRIGNLANMPVAIDTPSRPIGRMSWRTHSSSYLSREPAGEERDEKFKRMLARVTEQTGLEFKIEEREVKVWVMSEAGK